MHSSLIHVTANGSQRVDNDSGSIAIQYLLVKLANSGAATIRPCTNDLTGTQYSFRNDCGSDSAITMTDAISSVRRAGHPSCSGYRDAAI